MNYKSDFTFFPCEHPRLVYNKYIKRHVMVSCGYCSACMSRKLTKYIPLIGNESACHRYTYFVTLTYNDDFCPCINTKFYVPKKNVQQFFELRRLSADYIKFVNNVLPYARTTDIQKFLKRLRKAVSKVSEDRIRYFISADYGSTSFRPHWHGLFFFDDERLSKEFSLIISNAWSLDGYSMGFTQTERAYGNGQYVAAYTRAVTNRPVIYDYSEFAPHPLFSRSFGHFVFSNQVCKAIILRGSTETTIYDVSQSKFRIVPLPASLSARLFPTIPTFNFLTHNERLAIYRIFASLFGLSRSYRVDYLYTRLQWDSFFNDYIYNGFVLKDKQVVDKLDRVFYVVKRLFATADVFSLSVSDLDYYIQSYHFNLFNKCLKLQSSFVETLLSNGVSQSEIDSLIDCSTETFLEHSPREFHPSYFRRCDILLKRLTKSKLNHQYLSLHPEYQQFLKH